LKGEEILASHKVFVFRDKKSGLPDFLLQFSQGEGTSCQLLALGYGETHLE